MSQGSIVSFLNARSLVKEDTSIFPSDIIFISVTRLLAEDDDDLFKIQNSLHRNDSSNTNGNRSSYGLAVYLKDAILSKVKKRAVLIERIQVMSVLYIHPQEKRDEVR